MRLTRMRGASQRATVRGSSAKILRMLAARGLEAALAAKRSVATMPGEARWTATPAFLPSATNDACMWCYAPVSKHLTLYSSYPCCPARQPETEIASIHLELGECPLGGPVGGTARGGAPGCACAVYQEDAAAASCGHHPHRCAAAQDAAQDVGLHHGLVITPGGPQRCRASPSGVRNAVSSRCEIPRIVHVCVSVALRTCRRFIATTHMGGASNMLGNLL